MSFYDDLAGVADDMLASTAFGQAGAIRRLTRADGGPGDVTSDAAVTDHACQLVAMPVRAKDVDGTVIKSGDWWVYVAPGGLSITPTTTDRVICSAGNLAIVDARNVAPAGTTTHFLLLARSA